MRIVGRHFFAPWHVVWDPYGGFGLPYFESESEEEWWSRLLRRNKAGVRKVASKFNCG
jgi:hypothetical protein